MPRKHLRSVESSYELDEDNNADKLDSVKLGENITDGKFTGYDPDNFYLRATDYQGHGKNVQVTIPTTFSGAIGQIMDADEFPYRNITDATRNWIIHGIVRDLRALKLGTTEVSQSWFAQVELERTIASVQADMTYLTNLDSGAAQLVKARAWQQLHALLWDADQIDYPKGLADQRDEITRKYRREIPSDFDPTYGE